MTELKNCLSIINTKSNSYSIYISTHTNSIMNSKVYNLESFLSIDDNKGSHFNFNFYELKMLIDELVKTISNIERNRDEILKTSNTNSYSFIRNMNNEFQGNSISVSFNLIRNNNRPVLLCSMILNNARDNKTIKLFENENFVKLKTLTDELKAITSNFHVLHSNNVLLAKINSINNDIVVEEDHKVNIDTNISKSVTPDYKVEEKPKEVDSGLKLDTNSNIPKSYNDTVNEPKIPQAVNSTPVVAPANQMMLDTFNGLDGFENDSLDVNITPNEPVRVNNNNTSDGGQGYSPF